MGRPLEDWELEMVLGGDGTPEMEAALARSAENQLRLARLQAEELAFQANLFRAECPSTLVLGEWHLQLVESQMGETIRAHLDLCPHCQEELNTLVGVLAQPLPASLPAQAAAPPLLKRIVMTLEQLLGDGGSVPAPALRGEPSSVCYAGGDYLLSLTRRQQEDGGVALVGSILAAEVSGRVSLKQGAEVVYETALSESATFAFDTVRPGRYELVIATPQAELIVPDLHFDT